MFSGVITPLVFWTQHRAECSTCTLFRLPWHKLGKTTSSSQATCSGMWGYGGTRHMTDGKIWTFSSYPQPTEKCSWGRAGQGRLNRRGGLLLVLKERAVMSQLLSIQRTKKQGFLVWNWRTQEVRTLETDKRSHHKGWNGLGFVDIHGSAARQRELGRIKEWNKEAKEGSKHLSRLEANLTAEETRLGNWRSGSEPALQSKLPHTG